jgi:hypothetical protein
VWIDFPGGLVADKAARGGLPDHSTILRVQGIPEPGGLSHAKDAQYQARGGFRSDEGARLSPVTACLPNALTLFANGAMQKLLAPDGKQPQQLIPVEAIGGWVMVQLIICDCGSQDWLVAPVLVAPVKTTAPAISELLPSCTDPLLSLRLDAIDIAPPIRPKTMITTTSL